MPFVPLIAAAAPGFDITAEPWQWAALLAFIGVLILADLLVFHREAHEISIREAALSSIGWISIGLAFGLFVWRWLGGQAATQYYTGYVIEKSLSVDNVFVWAVILGYFAVPKALQHRVLFWGIFGALVLRAIFIFAGVALLDRFEWLLVVFGAFLIVTAWRVATHGDSEIHPEHNPLLRIMRRIIPVTADFHGTRFTIKEAGKRFATPLLVVLVLIEATDVVFAVDSIPAILAISRSQFIVFSSNAFAILGLRSLYFLLVGAQDKLVYLDKGLGIILAFVGTKMLLSWWDIHIPTPLSLAFIAMVLLITVLVSFRASGRSEQAARSDDADENRSPVEPDER